MATVSASVTISHSGESISDSFSVDNGEYNYYSILLPDELFSMEGGMGGSLKEKSLFSHSKSVTNEQGKTNMGISFSTDSGTYGESSIYGGSDDSKPVAINFACNLGDGSHFVNVWNDYGGVSLDLASMGAEFSAGSKITKNEIEFSTIGSFHDVGELFQELSLSGAEEMAIDIEGRGDVKDFTAQASLQYFTPGGSKVGALMTSESDNQGWLEAKISGNVDEYSFAQHFNGNDAFKLSSQLQFDI